MRIKASFIIAGAVLLVCSYIILAFGIFDMLIIKPYRFVAVDTVEQASSKTPPDWEYLLKSLHHPDWFVVAMTLAEIAEIQRSNGIPQEIVNIILQKAFTNVGEHGHWWRFGWDMEDPEFEQFRSQLIGTVSSFRVDDLLPYLKSAAQDREPIRRKTVCWVVSEMTKATNGQQPKRIVDLYAIVDFLAQNDSEQTVKSVCSAALSFGQQ